MWSRYAFILLLLAASKPLGPACDALALPSSTRTAPSRPTTALEEEAERRALNVLFGGNRARVFSADDDPHGVLEHFVLVQDQYLHKAAAVAKWTSTAATDGVSSRRLMKHTGKKKKPSKCFTVSKTKLQGGTLRNGRSKVPSWGTCCQKCTLNPACGWWSFKSKSKDGRGKGDCYLKGFSGFVRYGSQSSQYRIGALIEHSRSPRLALPHTLTRSRFALILSTGKTIGRRAPPPPPRPPPPPSPPPPPPPTESPSPPPATPRPPPPPPMLAPPLPQPPPLPAGRAKYAEVLDLTRKFYQAQRSGPLEEPYEIPWRRTSFLFDPVVGGWFDAGDYLKLNFPMSHTVATIGLAMIDHPNEFGQSWKDLLRTGLDYFYDCIDMNANTYVGAIGLPWFDHNQWGRDNEVNQTFRPASVYDSTMLASDLYCSTSAALSTGYLVFKDADAGTAERYRNAATYMYDWCTRAQGKYSNYYTDVTKATYPSSSFADDMALAAGLMFQTTGNGAYLDQAIQWWRQGDPEVYPGWDSKWGQAGALMMKIASSGNAVPGIETYRAFMNGVFFPAWLNADGFQSIIKTPKGMAYPSWNKWGNLAFSSTAASIAMSVAEFETDQAFRKRLIDFAQAQTDYALGSQTRSYVPCWGTTPPSQPHHAGASCPLDRNLPCGWPQFSAPTPNPNCLRGSLIAGPGGQRVNPIDPDNSFVDIRSDYVTNEPAVRTDSHARADTLSITLSCTPTISLTLFAFARPSARTITRLGSWEPWLASTL